MDEQMCSEHRLDGLVSDNMLAFLALLGLLRCLQEQSPSLRFRVHWSFDRSPLRPVLTCTERVSQMEVCSRAAEGLQSLARSHSFDGRKDIDYSPQEARRVLRAACLEGGYRAEIISAIMSDAAVRISKGKPADKIEPSPLCLLFGQGHQHFLERLASVPVINEPQTSSRKQQGEIIGPAESIYRAVFLPWTRSDRTQSFRWDASEDARYAYMFGNPTKLSNKHGTQHGANRLACFGMSVFTVVPQRRGSHVRIQTRGVAVGKGLSVTWPLWKSPLSLLAIKALLSRSDVDKEATQDKLDIGEVMQARRINVGKYISMSAARPLSESGAPVLVADEQLTD